MQVNKNMEKKFNLLGKPKSKVSLLWQIVFIIFVITIIYPLLFVIANSFKTDSEAFTSITSLIPQSLNFDNYIAVFEALPLLRIIGNTFLMSTVVTIVRMVLAFLAAYALVYFTFKGKKIYMGLINLTLFLPFTVMMIPNYLTLAEIGLTDNIWGVMLPMFFSATGVFMIVQNMKTIPKSLIEVAKLDRIPDFRIMKEIILPLIRPQLIATGVWFFTGTWNEYIWPRLILKDTDNYTLSIALQMFTSGEGGQGFTSVMAMSVITMIIPLIVYLIFQKYIIDTFTSSGIK